MAVIDVDRHGAASHRNMAEHLTGPLQAGAVESPLAPNASGVLTVTWATRHPVLLAAPAAALGSDGLRLTVTLPAGDDVDLVFAPYTERGAFLPVYLPPVDPAGIATGFSVSLVLRIAAPDGAETLVAVAGIGGVIELRLVEGLLGRLSYVLGAEKARLRRGALELLATRQLDAARDHALDRFGADLGVPRFAETLAFAGGEVVTNVRREPDDEFRRRLSVYRPWLLPTPRTLLSLLNGPGNPGDPNAGLLAGLGLADRFTLSEDDNDFAVAIKIVGVEDPVFRTNFLEFVRNTYLVWPRTDAASNAAHNARFRFDGKVNQDAALRKGLRDHFDLPTGSPRVALAPQLASALVRVGRCRAALGETTKWAVLRGQDSAGGSRYELGLGADLQPLAAAELNRLRTAHAGRTTDPDPELEALLASMTPATAAADPQGRWLLEPCGLKTVHRVDSNTLYVSHLPIFGLVITGPNDLAPGGWAEILSGSFEAGSRDDLLLYERTSGNGEFLRNAGSGSFPRLRLQTGWRTTWTQIVPGNFGGTAFTDLLFYERASGTAAVYTTDGTGGIVGLRGHTGWRRTWSRIVPGNFGRSAFTDLLFYDRSQGEVEIYTTDGAGNIAFLARHRNWRKTWTHLVPARLGGPGSFTDVIAYERASGDLHLFRSDGHGGLRPLRRVESFRPGFTHLVPGTFGLLGYDRKAGVGEFYTFNSRGRPRLVRRHEGWRKTWTQIVAGDFGGSSSTDLLFYDRAAGAAEVYSTDSAGGIAPLGSYTGWRRATGAGYEAHLHAQGDPGSNAVLLTAVQAADAAWQAAPHNGPAWTQLTDAQASAAWATAVVPATLARAVFQAAGLPVVADVARAAQQLGRIPPELIETVRLAPSQAAAILGGSSAAATQLAALVGVLRSSSIASALPLVTSSGEVLVVLGVIGLPEAGLNLSDRRSSGFRWYAVPIQGTGAAVSTLGSRTLLTPADAGVYALVVLGYARAGKTDPYEFRVELPDGVTLSLLQYEFLMNILDHAYPAGVEVNTFAIRKGHVDLDGDGDADALAPAVSRTYRTFRRRRHRGEIGATLDP